MTVKISRQTASTKTDTMRNLKFAGASIDARRFGRLYFLLEPY